MTGPITLIAVAGCLLCLWVGAPILMWPFLLAVVLAFATDLLS